MSLSWSAEDEPKAEQGVGVQGVGQQEARLNHLQQQQHQQRDHKQGTSQVRQRCIIPINCSSLSCSAFRKYAQSFVCRLALLC